jgi:RNA polymerase sigma factor (TIGR02999 family)
MTKTAPRHFQPNPAPITHLLARCGAGDRGAADELIGVVYNDLRAMARAKLRKHANASLEPTELVNLACMRLMGPGGAEGLSFQNRRHMYGSAARAMMQVLSNHARDKKASKRTPPGILIAVEENIAGAAPLEIDICKLESALASLEQLEPTLAEVFYLHALAGLTHEQVGQVVEVGPATAKQKYDKAVRKLRKLHDGQPRA